MRQSITARRNTFGATSVATIEGVFSVFKRGRKGIYQHCETQHLHRYLAEFDFRYNKRIKLGINGCERADIILAGVSGKRLRYQTMS